MGIWGRTGSIRQFKLTLETGINEELLYTAVELTLETRINEDLLYTAVELALETRIN